MLIVYTKTGCPWCRDALARLRSLRVSFEEREVTGNKVYFDELVALSGQTKTPTVAVAGLVCADASDNEIEAFLRANNLLPQ